MSRDKSATGSDSSNPCRRMSSSCKADHFPAGVRPVVFGNLLWAQILKAGFVALKTLRAVDSAHDLLYSPFGHMLHYSSPPARLTSTMSLEGPSEKSHRRPLARTFPGRSIPLSKKQARNRQILYKTIASCPPPVAEGHIGRYSTLIFLTFLRYPRCRTRLFSRF